MNIKPDDDFIQKMLDWRSGAFARKPDDVPVEEHEAAWIADEICFAEEAISKELEKEAELFGGEFEDLDEVMSWRSHDSLEKIEREYNKRSLALENEAKQAFEELVNVLRSQKRLVYSDDEDVGEEEVFGPELSKALQILRERFSRPMFECASGNFISNRSYAIANFWPVLKAAGYGMRAASRVLANAFEKAGKEQGEAKKRAGSIFQVIYGIEHR